MLEEHQPLLYRGDRIAFSARFLETALQMAQASPEGRTIFVELTDVSVNPDGSKLIGIRRNLCPICTGNLDESPHEPTHCPALQVPEV